MRYRYFTCDVFTDTRFGGNQLAVLPQADGLDDGQMQRIAREFNYSESTFVFPPEGRNTRKVRIFTPASEVPFAGHPNVGTAFVLATAGLLDDIGSSTSVIFEEKAGLVPITIQRKPGGRITCELAAPQRLAVGKTFSVQSVAAAISLAPGDILTSSHAPLVASVGLPFLIAELKNVDALKRAEPTIDGFKKLVSEGLEPPYLHLYVKSADGFDLRTRMFAPLDGIIEDPATGSANCALAGLLSHLEGKPDGAFAWRIAQGFEMGRPSVLEARTAKAGGVVENVWIKGESVLVCEGHIEV